MNPRHFLTLTDFTPDELRAVVARAGELRQLHYRRKPGEVTPEFLKNRVLGMIFEKSSTRTRVSFESAMIQAGGGALFLAPDDTQLGRGETIADTARVISRMVDAVVIRTFGHDRIEEFARHSQVPVINALTDQFHPCQLLADMQTYQERRGDIRGRTVAWIGDGNNMCNSYINAARQFDFNLRIACPEGFEPDPALVEANRDRVEILRNPVAAATRAHLVTTDVWASMGQEGEARAREQAFKGYQVTRNLLDRAQADVAFMHCLPAHRGEEVSEDLLEDPRSVVWDQAENRLHAQKALLEFLIGGR